MNASTRRSVLAGSLALLVSSAHAKAPLGRLVPKPRGGDATGVGRDGVIDVGDLPEIDLTGAQDMTAPLQAALDALAARAVGGAKVGGVLRFPHGAIVRVGGTLNYDSDGPLSIVGGTGMNRKAARIIQDGRVLFNIVNSRPGAEASGQNQVEIGGLELQCMYTGKDDACAFRIHEPESVYAHDIRASAGRGAWEVFFDLRNVRGAVFERMYVRNDHGLGDAKRPDGGYIHSTGDRSADIRGTFFVFENDGRSSTDNRFHDLTVQGFDLFLGAQSSVKPNNEGFQFSGVSVVGCNTGILWTNKAEGYVPPLFDFHDGHMHVFKQVANLQNVAQFFLKNSTLELDHQYDSVNGASGLSLISLSKVNRLHLSDLVLVTGRAVSPIAIFPGCDGGSIHDISGQMQNAPAIVQILAGSKNIHVHHVGGYHAKQAVLNGDPRNWVDNCRTYN